MHLCICPFAEDAFAAGRSEIDQEIFRALICNCEDCRDAYEEGRQEAIADIEAQEKGE